MKTFVVGIVGGIGAGKSTIATAVNKLTDCQIIDGDKLGHEVLTYQAVINKLTGMFGQTICQADGSIDRRQLGHLVFGTDEPSKVRLHQLTSVMYPEIGRLIQQQIQHCSDPLCLLDAAMMFEAGWDSYCNEVAFLDVPDTIRLKRVVTFRGWTEAQWREREMNQLSLAVKKRRSSLQIPYGECADVMAKSLLHAIQDSQRCQWS